MCDPLGAAFTDQLGSIFEPMLHVYQLYSTHMSEMVAEKGPYSAQHSLPRVLRKARAACNELLCTFIKGCHEAELDTVGGRTLACTLACAHARLHARLRARSPARTLACTRARLHARTHTHTHARTHARARTHTCR